MNPTDTDPTRTQPSATLLGLILGLAVGAAAAFGGFAAFLVVLVLGAAGLLVGQYLDGRLDLSALGVGSDRFDRADR